MNSDSILCRLAIYNQCINTETGEFDDENFLHFNREKTRDSNNGYGSSFVLSVISMDIGEAQIHERGLLVAKIKNDRKNRDSSNNLNEENKTIYLGYYEIKYTTIN